MTSPIFHYANGKEEESLVGLGQNCFSEIAHPYRPDRITRVSVPFEKNYRGRAFRPTTSCLIYHLWTASTTSSG